MPFRRTTWTRVGDYRLLIESDQLPRRHHNLRNSIFRIPRTDLSHRPSPEPGTGVIDFVSQVAYFCGYHYTPAPKQGEVEPEVLSGKLIFSSGSRLSPSIGIG